MKKILVLFTVTAFLFSCKKDDNKAGIFKGEDVAVHHGKAWSWVKLNESGNPEALSITLDEAAIQSVSQTGNGGHTHENNIMVPLHNKAKETTPFEFIMVNWNPEGHEPAGIYTLPHFDFHYYMTGENEVMNYTDPVKLENSPAADYVPANHISGPGVPRMGKHWIDITSPELSGQVPFTQTFIYGSYDGKMVFMEPMITLDFLKNTSSFERPIPQPAKFKETGYYPTKMRVIKQAGTTNIILDGFVLRQGS